MFATCHSLKSSFLCYWLEGRLPQHLGLSKNLFLLSEDAPKLWEGQWFSLGFLLSEKNMVADPTGTGRKDVHCAVISDSGLFRCCPYVLELVGLGW